MSNIGSIEELLGRLNQIGIALSCERDLEKLLSSIVSEARKFTSAEAGTLYSVEKDRLRFLVTQNDALDQLDGRGEYPISTPGQWLPLSRESMAGYVALTGEVINLADVYAIPPDRPYHFNADFDRLDQYRSQSMLMVPMTEPDGTILGVLQLINALDGEGRVTVFESRWEGLVRSLASQAAVAIRNVRLTDELKAAYLDTILRLSVAAEYKDQDTANHIRRMAQYSAVIAEELGLAADQVETLRCAAPMHDVGKIGVREAILQKPGKLTAVEYEEMQRHTEMGARLFDGADAPVLRMSGAIALTHHEKYDGTGYPHGLRGEEIPIEGQIAALADVFDALSTARCYKPAFPVEKCLQIVRESTGSHFSPAVVDAFIKRLDDILAIRERYGAGDAAPGT